MTRTTSYLTAIRLRLHEALEKAKVPNQLLTIKDGGHGGFSVTDYVRSYETIWIFTAEQGYSVGLALGLSQ